MPTAYAYLRVSTDAQDLSPEWQRQVCLKYYEETLKARGFDLGQVFEDIGQSAYAIPWAEREQGRELFKVIRPGDAIIAAKQDRLWRTVRDKENSMFFCKQMNIGLVILDMGVDMSTAAGKFASGIIALQSQWESDVRSERMRAAASIRRQRRTPGKRSPPPGWKFDKVKGELIPDLRERKLLDLIYQWRAKRVRSIEKTCRWLTEEGIRRDSGAKYNVQWVQRAWLSRQKGWPQEGYVQTFWRDPSVPAAEKDKYRLPKVGGKQYVNFHSKRVRRMDEADLRWLIQAFPKSDGVPCQTVPEVPNA
jgi:DNA invertase Pin-like site-specific DNA recombinase